MHLEFRISSLTAAGVAAVVLSACGSTTVSTRVERAPWIAIRGAQNVSLELKTDGCADIWMSPKEGRATLYEDKTSAGVDGAFVTRSSTSVTLGGQQQRIERSCIGSDFAQSVESDLRRRLERRLVEAGFQPTSGGGAEATLRGTLVIVRERNVKPPHDEQDKKGETPVCAKTCGQPKCKRFSQETRAEARLVLDGPPDPMGQPQKAEWNFNGSGLPTHGVDSISHYGCSLDDGINVLNNESNYDWARAREEMAEEAAGVTAKFFKKYSEDYDLRLLTDVDELPEGKAALADAKVTKWAAAESGFAAAAASEMAEIDPKDRVELKAHALHNQAAVIMAQGRLEEAIEVCTKARELQPDDEDVLNLGQEIIRRLVDRAKLGGPLPGAGVRAAAPANAPKAREVPQAPETTQPPDPATVPEAPTAAAEVSAEAPAVTPVVEAVAAPPAPIEAPAEQTAVEAPVAARVAPPPQVESGRACVVAGRAAVKFRVDASHRATPTGLVPAGAAMRCFEIKNGWRRVELIDGSVRGYLPENLVRLSAE